MASLLDIPLRETDLLPIARQQQYDQYLLDPATDAPIAPMGLPVGEATAGPAFMRGRIKGLLGDNPFSRGISNLSELLGIDFAHDVVQRDIGGMGTTPLERGLAAAMVLPIPMPGKGKVASKIAQTDLFGTGVRGISAVPNLRNIELPEAIGIARAEPHLIKAKDKQYVGGPRGLKSKQGVRKMRGNFDDLVDYGLEGAPWYIKGRAFNVATQGANPARQRLGAQEQALWSAQARPDTNLGFALQARNAYEAGVPLDKVRTGAQAQKYLAARGAMEPAQVAGHPMMGHNLGPPLDDVAMPAVPLGKKTDVYGQNLDPTVPFSTTGTNDIWHARAFGFTNPGGKLFDRALTKQEHIFLDYETVLAVDRANARKLGGRDDWTASEIQAAAWVGAKGKKEGLGSAAAGYPEAAGKYTMFATPEQVPGRSSGLLGNIINEPYATKEQFTNRARWLDETGRDPLYGGSGMYTLPTVQGPSAYVNSQGLLEVNPVQVARPLVSFKPGGKDIAAPVQATVEATESVRGLLDFQEGSAANMILRNYGPSKEQVHLAVDFGRMPTVAEAEKLARLAGKHNMDLASADYGVNLLNFAAKQNRRVVRKRLDGGIAAEIQAIVPGAKIETGSYRGAYIDRATKIASENMGKGQATRQVLKYLKTMKKEAPRNYERLLDNPAITAKAKANLERLVEYGGKGQRPDYERLLDIVGDGGLRGLLSRIKLFGGSYRGGVSGLPVLALAALGLDSHRRSSSTSPME